MMEATLLFQWAGSHLQSIKAEHLPGVDNLEADWLSHRKVHKGEWSLHPEVFELLTQAFSQPEVALFASQENAQVPAFLSQTLNPLALGTNVLFFLWPCVLLYAFPPFPLIQTVIQWVKSL